jgi:hypothetical protein
MSVSRINCFTDSDQGLYPRSTWVYDTASDTHICNDLSYFTSYKPSSSIVYVGDTQSKILGFGTAEFTPSNTYGTGTIFELKNCAYVPNFHINVISSSKAKDAGLFMNHRALCLETLDRKPVCEIKEGHGILLIK